MPENYEPFDQYEIDENLPTLAIIMAIAINQGTSPEVHLRVCDILQRELEIGLNSVPDEESAKACYTALRAVATHRRSYAAANDGPIDTDTLFSEIEDYLKKEDNDGDS